MNVSRLVPVAAAALLASAGPASAARVGGPPVAAFTAEPPARLDLTDLGRAPAATPVSLAVMLKYRNQAELDQLVLLQATPGSPLFHHFITRAQFAAEFSPTPADYLRVVQSLRAAGFAVRPGLPNRTIVDADGTASAAERYFGTQIHRVGQTGYGIRYANATTATVPAAIADVVRSVAGLDNVVEMKSDRVPAVNVGAAPSFFTVRPATPSAVRSRVSTRRPSRKPTTTPRNTTSPEPAIRLRSSSTPTSKTAT